MILDKTFPPDPRVENEAISLVNNGFEVYLFCLTYNDDTPKEETYQGFYIKRYSSNTLTYKLSALAYTVPFYTQIMRKKIYHFLIENAIHAIHIHDIRIAEAVFKANKKLQLPTVLDLHDNIPEIMKFYPHLQKFPGKYLISPKKWKQKEEDFIQNATKIITVSKAFKNEVVQRTKINETKIEVVPNTVRKSFYQKFIIINPILNRYKDAFIILYLGDTGIRRGLLTAIEGVAKLKDKIPFLKLVIVGSNSTDAILKQKVRELFIENYVDFQGWQEVSYFPSYIMASTLCISPLYRNPQHDVAYANKLFQYMSFEKPVLVSDALAQKNLIEKIGSGLVYKEKNGSDFAEKVLYLYHHEKKRKAMGKKGKQFISKEFNWDITEKKLIEIYQDILH